MKKIAINEWKWTNGHKTIIFNTSAAVLQQAINYDLIKDTKGMQFTIGLLLTFGGGSLVHHIRKGIKK